MPMKVCIYEDDRFAQFYPLTSIRPVYLLRAGILSLYERVHWHFSNAGIILAVRDSLSSFIAEQMPDYPVNIIKREKDEVLFLNGRIRDYGDLPGLIKETTISTVFKNKGQTVAVLFKPDTIQNLGAVVTPQEFVGRRRDAESHIADFDTTATLYNYCWEIVVDLETGIEQDFAYLKESAAPSRAEVHDGAYLINRKNIYLGDGAEILPGSVIDASKGPVYIGMNTRVESHVAVYGPCSIGPNSILAAGKVSGSSIGHTCRVGGEVEGSVFHPYVNKYHAGFIGHSYVGSWVNFGAMTTNSDLKNNYSCVRVTLAGEVIDTGTLKVGSFIGDHTKFGIGALLTTGINIGVCCNILGGALVSDREIPPFSWGSSGKYEAYQFDKAIETVRRAMERRNQTLSEREIAVLKSIAESSTSNNGTLVF